MTTPEGITPYDLAPVTNAMMEEFHRRQLTYQPLRNALRPETAADRAAWVEREADLARRRADAAAALELALADWGTVGRTLHANPVAQAVLAIHRPQTAGWCDDRVGCTECVQHNDYDDVEAVGWPCPTYTAVRNPGPVAYEPDDWCESHVPGHPLD